MFLVSVSRNVAGDLFAEMHDHSLVFLLMNDLLPSIMHGRQSCFILTLFFVFICCLLVHSEQVRKQISMVIAVWFYIWVCAKSKDQLLHL